MGCNLALPESSTVIKMFFKRVLSKSHWDHYEAVYPWGGHFLQHLPSLRIESTSLLKEPRSFSSLRPHEDLLPCFSLHSECRAAGDISHTAPYSFLLGRHVLLK